MIKAEKIFKVLVKNDIDFFTGVPDSLLKDFCAYITDHTTKERNIITANEGLAIGIASGHYLATGKIPLVYMQNSGIGNAVNPLLSLADEKVYSFPIILVIGWRGEPGIKDEPQHKKQGEVTLDLLNAMHIPYILLDFDEKKAINQINKLIKLTIEKSIPHAIIVRKNTFENYNLKNKSKNKFQISREEAMKLVVSKLGDKDIIVSSTGKLSRELYEFRENTHHSHENDFLTVGSMGHSSSIALGIAIEKKNRNVYCFDGDGAFIMHMGAITNIGNLSPKNYRHIIFNNGVHESVGEQPTLGYDISIPSIAKACGYKKVIVATTEEEILKAMSEITNCVGPALLEVMVKIDSRDNLGRPSITTTENKIIFMNFIK